MSWTTWPRGSARGSRCPSRWPRSASAGPSSCVPPSSRSPRTTASAAGSTRASTRLKARLADPVADRIIEALRLAREVGGNDLGRLLRTLGGFLRTDLRTRGELEARQSWTVNAARLAVAAPWIVLALLASRPEATAAFRTGAGAAVLAIGALSSVIAYRLMVAIGRLPDERRVLR